MQDSGGPSPGDTSKLRGHDLSNLVASWFLFFFNNKTGCNPPFIPLKENPRIPTYAIFLLNQHNDLIVI